MIVVADWLGLDQTETNTAFEVIIQFAAILAVVANYRDKISPRHFMLWVKIAIAFVPIGAVGFAFRHQVKALFSVEIVAVMFILGGIVFLVVEHFYEEKAAHVTDVEQATWRQAVWIGIAQVFALIPGTSRAGSTIIGALLVGLDRKAAAEFSFLLALPVMLATSGYDLLKNYRDFAEGNLVHLGVGLPRLEHKGMASRIANANVQDACWAFALCLGSVDHWRLGDALEPGHCREHRVGLAHHPFELTTVSIRSRTRSSGNGVFVINRQKKMAPSSAKAPISGSIRRGKSPVAIPLAIRSMSGLRASA